eukprot:6385997-Pyramimonas_sp.AAC.1
MFTPHGFISYYRGGFFVAQCLRDGHHKCSMQRTAFPSEGAVAGVRAGQGRPLARLACWLDFNCANKAAHTPHQPSLAARQAKRAQLENGGPIAQRTLSFERAQRPGEPSEPDFTN